MLDKIGLASPMPENSNDSRTAKPDGGATDGAADDARSNGGAPYKTNDGMPVCPSDGAPEKPNDGVSGMTNGNASKQSNKRSSEQPIEGEEEGEFEQEEGFDDTDYVPDFIKAALENPPVLPGESNDEFIQMFESYEYFHNGRAKTLAEYMMVYRATTITWELMRYERLKVKILVYQGRFAAEAVHRRAHEYLATEGEPKNISNSGKKWSQHYFTDPEYRKAYAAKLEAAGFGDGAIDAEAFQRSVLSLGHIERLIAGLEKRLFSILKTLDQTYAGRHPHKKIKTVHEPLPLDER